MLPGTKLSIIIVFLLSLLLPALSPAQTSDGESLVVISTPRGDITLKLYDETPLHRNNFMKLAREGYFDSTLFHRVIRNFMIQGGDPDSKKASAGERLGEGGPGYNLTAEIIPEHFHKRGALAAAREDDKLNPKRLSSGSQFYIVQGRVYSQTDLDKIENEQNSLTKQRIFVSIMDNPANLAIRNQFFSPDAKKDSVHFRFLLDTLNKMIDLEYTKIPGFRITEEQRLVYTTIGGSPQLDGKYTVFGEVLNGMEVVDAIAAEKTDKNDRPLNDIRMNVKIISRKKSQP